MDSGHPKSRPPLIGRPLIAVALVTFAVALLAIDARATYGARVTADEPQYLLTALSLGEDADLDIADELQDERFLPFHELALNPQTIELNRSGQRLSPHDPGLPVILAAPMRIGGWVLARITMAFLAGLAASATFWVAVRRFGVSVGVSSVVSLCFFVTPPLVGYATQIYPEMPAALAVITGIGAVTRPVSSRFSRSLVAVVIITLPWLAVKYVPVAAVFAIALLFRTVRNDDERHRSRRSWLSTAATAGVLVVMAGVYLIVHRRIYGGWTVYSTGDHFVDSEFQVVGSDPDYVGRSRRLVGLLVDRAFGLMAWAPAYLLLVPALVSIVRRRVPGGVLLVTVVAAGWAVATWVALTMHGWWWPGRQVVVILPVAVVAVAVLVERLRALLVPVVVASSLTVVNWLWLIFEASTGRRTLIVDFTETASPLYRLWSAVLPDHRTFAASDTVLTGLWAVVLCALGLWAWLDAGIDEPGGQAADAVRAAPEPNTGGSEEAPVASGSPSGQPL